MSFSFIRTALKVQSPLRCFGTLAAMAFLVDSAIADDEQWTQPKPAVQTKLLVGNDKIEFSPIPKLNSRVPNQTRLRTVSPINQSRGVVQTGTGSVQDFFGKVEQSSGPAVSAKMVIPKSSPIQQSTQAQAAKLSPAPRPRTQQAASSKTNSNLRVPRFSSASETSDVRYPAALATFTEPAVQSRVTQPNDFQFKAPSLRRTQAPKTAARIATRPAVASFSPATLPIPKAFSGTHRLRNIDMNRFEKSVVQIWGERLRTSTTDDGRYVKVELPTSVADPVTMVVDRQTDTISYKGGEELKDNWHQVIENIDALPQRMVDGSLRETRLIDVSASPQRIRQVAYLARGPQDDQVQLPAGALPAEALGQLTGQQEIPAGTRGIKNPVQVIQDPQLGVIKLSGDPEDVAIIRQIILDISKKFNEVQPEAERIPLTNLQSEAVAQQIQSLYDASGYPESKGPVQVQPLASPNSLIVVGQKDAIEAVRKIVQQMDVESAADEAGGFKAIRLKYISAADAALRLNTYFGQAQAGAGDNVLPSAPVTVIPDFRSNTVVVKGSIQFINQAEQFIETIDVIDSPAVNEVKVIPLRNTVAADMAVVIQDAINGQQQNSGLGLVQNQQGQNQTQNAQPQSNTSTLRSALLSLRTIDKSGKEIVGGIMFDVRVTADANSNSLVVTGPKESMPLIEALVHQLDRLPNSETLIKVFEIVNGDAQTLLEMLEALFGADQNNQQNQGGTNLNQLPLQGAAASDGQTLVNLRFSVDLRTNTIIASGPAGDLQVVEDLLNRLDARESNDAPAQVYRLSNAPAIDVAEAINAWLDGVVDLAGTDPRQNNGVSTSDRTVIVVPEVVSNSLIVSARPEYREEVEKIIRALDRRPPLVKVKMLIAEIDLTTLEEFGVEVGLQDSLLFDRGTLFDAAGDITSGIGFPFNSGAVANSNANSRESFAGQALSNLGTGRINTDLGYGGLVLSAGNESVNVLLRALKDRQCVRVLSKPHIMTIENLQGRVSIGAEVPRVAGTTVNGVGNVTQDIEFVDVGVILAVTPRVSPDGMIVMTVDVQKSSVGPDATGITIGFGANGEPIIAPQIIETEANTTLMARSGQTVVFSGLIQEEKSHAERGAPILSDLPFIGPLFKFESDAAVRSELLIIMTPYLITDDDDIDAANYDEIERVHWCECDVAEVYGNTQYNGRQTDAGAIETFYPDADPTGSNPYMLQQQQGDFIDAPQPTIEAIPQAKANSKSTSSVRRASYSVPNRRVR